MDSVVITLYTPTSRAPVDLELPGRVPVHKLIPVLLSALQLPSTDSAGKSVTYQLVHQSKKYSLRERETLSDAGIVTGDVLFLVSTASQIKAEPGGPSRTRSSASALLRCPSGMVIALDNYGKSELTIGRYDARTGKTPDIELSEESEGNTVSRSHALLRKQGNRWTLVPLSTKNPTKVGNTRLAPQQVRSLKSGDVITLGGVRLVFESR